MIALEDVFEAERRLQGVINRLPVEQLSVLSEFAGQRVYAKPEHRQRTGSFKIRGAYNRIRRIADDGIAGEVVAGSAGNHAQGVALAAQLTGLAATIFMPAGVSLPKLEATRHYGARVELSGMTVDDSIEAAQAYAAATGAVYVPPFDDPMVIAGQGTIGLEIAREAPDVATVVVPIGGGGLIAGIATALKLQHRGVRVIGVEAEGAASMTAALASGHPVLLDEVHTVADGIAVRKVSDLTLEHVQAYVDDVVTVSEDETSAAVLLLLERAKWVVEPAGAVAVAALMSGRVRSNGPVVPLISGGNVDPLLLCRIVEHGLSAAGRYLIIRVVLDDRPGSLAALTDAVAKLDLNVLGVDHHRSGAAVGITEVEVMLTVETRDPDHRDEIVGHLQQLGFRAAPLVGAA